MSLHFESFSRVNRDRCEASNGFNHALQSWTLSDWFTAALGELGEAANVAKKLNRIRDGIKGNTEGEADLRAKLRAEIADTFIYLDLLAQSAGFSLAEAVVETFDRKSAQIGYPIRLGEPSPAPYHAPLCAVNLSSTNECNCGALLLEQVAETED